METFRALEQNYEDVAASAAIRPECERPLAKACGRLLGDKKVYVNLEALSSVPTAVLMALSEREMDGNLNCYLGNGQRLTMRTTIVPLNRGPWPDTPEGFIQGALDALQLDGLDQYSRTYGGWSLPLLGFASENWNGWGYRSRGIPSPYFVGGTTAQRPGKFVRDHVYNSIIMDPQLGTLAIVEELVKIDPSLKFWNEEIPKIESPSMVPVVPHPVIGSSNVTWVQNSLNRLRVPGTPLLVDDNCGRATMAVVRTFEREVHLVPDGLPGPKVVAALRQRLAERAWA